MTRVYWVLYFIVHTSTSIAQITNLSALDSLVPASDKTLVFLGEQHTSAANPIITYELIKHLNRTRALTEFFIEFGPSETYLYNLYLKTGEERLLKGTLYGGVFNEWKTFWKKLYVFNTGLPSDRKLEIIGVDFDKPQTFAFALNELVKGYDFPPGSLDSLHLVTQTESFSALHNNRFPSGEDKKFMISAQDVLKGLIKKYPIAFKDEDLAYFEAILRNSVQGFGGDREHGLYQNINRHIAKSPNTIFFMLTGQGHANYATKNIAHLLKSNPTINVVSGLIIYHNSEISRQGFNRIKISRGLENKPWKKYKEQLGESAVTEHTLIDLALIPQLLRYADYIIVSKDQKLLSF